MRPKRSRTASTRASDLLGLADVGRLCQALAPGGLDRGPRLLERLGPPSADRHARSGAGELERRRAADSGPAAGDERDEPGVRVGGERRPELAHVATASGSGRSRR